MIARLGDFEQRDSLAALHEFKLSELPHTPVVVAEKLCEFQHVQLSRAAAQQLGDLLHDFGVIGFFVREAVDAPLAEAGPTVHPVGDIHAAIGAELDVGREHAPDRFFGVDQLEERAIRLIAKSADARVVRRAAKIAQERSGF